jgi:hypothetical protein
MDLVLPVTDIAKALGLKYRVGNDRGAGSNIRLADKTEVLWGTDARGHFQSEYVMLAKEESYFNDFLKKEINVLPPESSASDIKNYTALTERGVLPEEQPPYIMWSTPPPPGNRLWTDDYSNMMSVFRWGFRH